MIVMGVESSCDETGVGIVRWNGDGTCELLADEVASSVDQHARYGGSGSRSGLAGSPRGDRADDAPCPCCRRYREARRAGRHHRTRPGRRAAGRCSRSESLCGSMEHPVLCGQSSRGHVSVDTLEHGPLPSCVALLVSGGHTHLLHVEDLASPLSNWARLSTTPPVRPSTRWPDCSDSAFPVDRHSMLLRKREIGTQSPSLAA